MRIGEFTEILIGKNISHVLDNVGMSNAPLSVLTYNTGALLTEKLEELGAQNLNVSLVYQMLYNKVLTIESRLAVTLKERDLTNVSSLKNLIDTIVSICNLDNQKGSFLKPGSALKLLETCPPIGLLEFLEVKTVSEACTKLDPLSLLSITRHTEDKTWQVKYLSQLNEMTVEDFEERKVQYNVIDWNTYGPFLKSKGRNLKPWSISHSKEFGVINCFTLDPDESYDTPLLMYTTVFLHYVLETTHAGSFTSHATVSTPSQIGSRVVGMIKSGERKHDFLPPNTYSEHLFWSESMKLFNQNFSNLTEADFFSNTLATGGWLPNEEPGPNLSLNIIDLIWDANIPSKGARMLYFESDNRKSQKASCTNKFVYHFQGALWYDTVQSIVEISPEIMADIIRKNLDLGDAELTQKLTSFNA